MQAILYARGAQSPSSRLLPWLASSREQHVLLVELDQASHYI